MRYQKQEVFHPGLGWTILFPDNHMVTSFSSNDSVYDVNLFIGPLKFLESASLIKKTIFNKFFSVNKSLEKYLPIADYVCKDFINRPETSPGPLTFARIIVRERGTNGKMYEAMLPYNKPDQLRKSVSNLLSNF